MKQKLFKRLFTRNLSKIPLFWATFNYNKYINTGKKGSCNLNVHPNLARDEHIKNTLNELVDYIRDNYDMNKI